MELIYAYTRSQALDDGVLVDVTKTANEAGFKYHTAITRAVWNEFVAVPEGVSCQDEDGRLWDILWMLRFRLLNSPGHQTETLFELHVRNDEGAPKRVTLKAVCGPGDDGEPVLTVMLPTED